jgi:hypothetical protein
MGLEVFIHQLGDERQRPCIQTPTVVNNLPRHQWVFAVIGLWMQCPQSGIFESNI